MKIQTSCYSFFLIWLQTEIQFMQTGEDPTGHLWVPVGFFAPWCCHKFFFNVLLPLVLLVCLCFPFGMLLMLKVCLGWIIKKCQSPVYQGVNLRRPCAPCGLSFCRNPDRILKNSERLVSLFICYLSDKPLFGEDLVNTKGPRRNGKKGFEIVAWKFWWPKGEFGSTFCFHWFSSCPFMHCHSCLSK